MHHRLIALAIAVLLTAACHKDVQDQKHPLVLAAASLQESLTKAAAVWAAAGHPQPTLSFAGSSALARQIESGAKADLFISADEQWMNDVEAKGLTKKDSRHDLLGNSLVLVAPANGPQSVSLSPGPVSQALGSGKIAMADPDSVPAGEYGKAALQKLSLWPLIQNRIAVGENVRAALAFVERGEAPLGIVYMTDAKVSKKVRVVAVFPQDSHPPIVYPVALLKAAGPEGADFEQFLRSKQGQAIFAAYGFTPRGD